MPHDPLVTSTYLPPSNHLDWKKYLPSLIELDHQLVPYPWSASQWEDLNNSQYGLSILHHHAKLCGFSLYQIDSEAHFGHLLKICLISELQGTGIAKSLLLHDFSAFKLQSVYLEVAATNERALAFYEKMGFKKIHSRAKYFKDGTDGIFMKITSWH